MRPSPTLLLLVLCPLVVQGVVSKCNYVSLVRCFINILDEWAWTLYELKDNVVTITSDQCVHLTELEKCINDDTQHKHTCSHEEVVEVSNTVSDLLTHRKNSGSFLKSYYLLTYACSEEGQHILSNHRECLRQEKIGEMTLSAGTYLTDKFIKDDYSDENACTSIQEKINEYVLSMSGLCKNEAAEVMCKSLQGMFTGLHTDRLADCKLTCPTLEDPTEEPSPNEPLETPSEPAGIVADSHAGFSIASATSLVVAAIILQ